MLRQDDGFCVRQLVWGRSGCFIFCDQLSGLPQVAKGEGGRPLSLTHTINIQMNLVLPLEVLTE